jgi:hypothetical protein
LKISELTDEELGAMCRDRFERLGAAHAAGLRDESPVDSWNADSKVLRDHAAQDDLPGNVASSKQIMDCQAEDDPPPTTGAARVPERPGAVAAAHDRAARDAALEELAIRQSGAADVEARIHLSRLKRGNSTAASRSAMDQMIPGYDRLGGRDTSRAVDDDGIVTRRK